MQMLDKKPGRAYVLCSWCGAEMKHATRSGTAYYCTRCHRKTLPGSADTVLAPDRVPCTLSSAKIAEELIAVHQQAQCKGHTPLLWRLSSSLYDTLIEYFRDLSRRANAHGAGMTEITAFMSTPIDLTSGTPHLLCDRPQSGGLSVLYELLPS